MTGSSHPFTELEELFDDFATLGDSPRSPAVDVVETDEAVTVFADLPGRDIERIEVNLKENRRLTISAGERATDSTGRHVIRERSTDPVSRVVSLPAAVDDEGTSATYDDGVLTVTLPKQETTESGTAIPVE